jgi:hypothetical protein
LLIARSQQRIEIGAPNYTSPPVEIAPFVVTSSARWVNGLWFVSLALSLSAALLAMTAKEWLDAFTTSHKRAPHDFALDRQARFDAFQWWRAPHIMDVLPTLLHVSLVLFSLGLVVYLWLLDKVIAIVLAAIIGATALLYLSTIALATLYNDCPFVTRISRYLRFAIDTYRHWIRHEAPRADSEPSNGTTAADLRALWWLLENARDQLSSDCVLQSLAGLHTRKIQDIFSTSKGQNAREQSQSKQLVIAQTCTRLCGVLESTLRRKPMEGRVAKGSDLRRYTSALSQLLAFMSGHSTEVVQDSEGAIDHHNNMLAHIPELVRSYNTRLSEIS